MFSTLDMRQGYYALRLDEASRAYTTFLTPKGAYQLLTLPTGAAVSPPYFLEAMYKILKYHPALDKNGDPIFDEPNKVRLIWDPIPDSLISMDDISYSTELCKTYKGTLDYHFLKLEEKLQCLSFHNLKLNVNKCEYGKNSFLYLGWIISQDYMIPDPRRMEKIKNATFPQTKKEMRSFLGLVNSIRRVINVETVREMNTLAPITSVKKDVPMGRCRLHILSAKNRGEFLQ